ncbi:MAG: ribosomal protein S18-alanine N-acetyltransferase [Gemmatimonadota bacterium]|nr:ribosomal protein S18-alanine N-acetyltransferase [Gemmatimonadota bacterium]MDH3368118.1 ribosomal protein S18-alanine N-acetyltransferase [Gemmatimonadota bacterium]MDH3478935.1 ribosomal protein S18-alanine N-acetyltransferase [Gemmatimonadota bacterium]MDH3569201.1 ribosomal protein S18-alanine N-acetyltransferase [Gemmatimonadota bacterium]MDH5550104.1 ribosomal protein S18-alanine N-acetyltransferase [Gemmatimonadota bacterium]
MGGRYRIRTATEADLVAVADIEREVFGDPWSLDSFHSALSDVMLVVTTGDRVAGYAVALGVADVGEILNVAVDPSHRRHGIARRLVREVCRQLADRGAETVFLEVRESNAAAQSLYHGLGFMSVGRRRSYYRAPREDALVLAAELPIAGPDDDDGHPVDSGVIDPFT